MRSVTLSSRAALATPPPPPRHTHTLRRYGAVEEILNDVLNATGSLAGGMGAHLNESVRAVMADLGELSEGARGARRAEVETRLSAHLAMLQALAAPGHEPEH